MKHAARALAAGALATSAWACASSTPTNELVDARRAYERAQASAATRYTPDDLLSARQALDTAEREHEDDPGSDREAHLAYLAARRAQIATARGEMAEAKHAEAKNRAEYQAQLERTAQTSQGELAKTQSELDKLREMATVKSDERGTVITLSGAVLFPSGSHELSPMAQQTLARVATALKDEHPEGTLVIAGHTDARGGAEMNEQLSQQRAQAVADYLASRGLDASKLKIVGRGENEPIASNDTSEGRANNRRVEIVIATPGAAQGTTYGATPPSRPTPGSAAKTMPDEPEKQTVEPVEPMEGQPQQQPVEEGAPPPPPEY